MIVFVDLEHERLAVDYPDLVMGSAANRLKIKYRLEYLAGEPCLIMRYHHVTPDHLRAVNARAVIVSGNTTEFEHYPEATDDRQGRRHPARVRPFILDATAGLGRDAFVLAQLGCTVTLIERQPLVAALLADGMRRGLGDAEVAPIIERMQLRRGNAMN